MALFAWVSDVSTGIVTGLSDVIDRFLVIFDLFDFLSNVFDPSLFCGWSVVFLTEALSISSISAKVLYRNIFLYVRHSYCWIPTLRVVPHPNFGGGVVLAKLG